MPNASVAVAGPAYWQPQTLPQQHLAQLQRQLPQQWTALPASAAVQAGAVRMSAMVAGPQQTSLPVRLIGVLPLAPAGPQHPALAAPQKLAPVAAALPATRMQTEAAQAADLPPSRLQQPALASALQQSEAAGVAAFPKSTVMTASMAFDGQEMLIKYGPGEDFESPADFFSPCHSEWREPYQAMLNFLSDNGWLDELPLDTNGMLNVAIPFCGSAPEIPVLAAFLSERFLKTYGTAKISIFGTDVRDGDSQCGYWRQKERYVARKYGQRLQLQFRTADLSREAHPHCALTLGMHPECTSPRSLWRQILANIIQGTRGVCVIATFKEEEMQVVQGVCQGLGANFEVHENLHWRNRPIPEGTTPSYLRFLVLVRCHTLDRSAR